MASSSDADGDHITNIGNLIQDIEGDILSSFEDVRELIFISLFTWSAFFFKNFSLMAPESSGMWWFFNSFFFLVRCLCLVYLNVLYNLIFVSCFSFSLSFSFFFFADLDVLFNVRQVSFSRTSNIVNQMRSPVSSSGFRMPIGAVPLAPMLGELSSILKNRKSE